MALAALLLIAGVIVWALTAIVPVTVNTTGLTLESPTTKTTVICWVDKPTAEKIEKLGGKANIDGVEAENVVVDPTPMSSSEVVSFLGSEFYVESLDLSDWNYQVIITPSEEPKHTDFVVGTTAGEAHLVPVSIIVAETQPINIVLGKE